MGMDTREKSDMSVFEMYVIDNRVTPETRNYLRCMNSIQTSLMSLGSF